MSTPVETTDIQSLVFSGHSKLGGCVVLGLAVQNQPSARRTLQELVERDLSFGFGGPDRSQAVQLLLTARGVLALGGTAADLAGFSSQFQEGIVTPQRSRALGDADRNDPAAWEWNDVNLHAVLLVYARDREQARDVSQALVTRLAAGWTASFSQALELPADNREPFGFRDGLSVARIDLGDGRTEPGVALVAPGEAVLGYPNAAGIVPLAPALGENGAHVALRQLEQDVEAFWKFWRSAGADEQEAVWLAAKAVGRWPNGMPVDGSAAQPEPAFDEAQALAPFRFDADARGLKCPFGAHVRRANPRDGLGDDPAASLEIVAHHRIIRRGRSYGPPAPPAWLPACIRDAKPAGGNEDADATRGLLFVAVCADLAGQFEFIQQTWLNNPKFSDLYDEVDAIAAGHGLSGDRHRFSIPRPPLRCRVNGVARWVRVRGGGYFLLPGKRALLRFLATR